MSEKKQWDYLSPNEYSYGLGSKANDRGQAINLENENREVSRFLHFLQSQHREVFFIIVPGFVPPTDEPIQLHRFTKIRLNMAVEEMNKHSNAVVFLTGGNVKPSTTPFNESMEMKRQLLNIHNVPTYRIAIDPNAQNTVTNFRNSGRFMLAHKVNKALVVTTFIQNFYISFPVFTFFKTRMRELLGAVVGDFEMQALGKSRFFPNENVWKKANNPIDP